MASKTLTEAASANDRKEILTALRDKLAETIENCESGRDIAALSKRLMEVTKELDEIGGAKKTNGKLVALQKKSKSRNVGA